MGWGGAAAGAGGRVLGLVEMGGCSTARYGVTTGKNPFITRLSNSNGSYATEKMFQLRGELRHCNTQVSNLLIDRYLEGCSFSLCTISKDVGGTCTSRKVLSLCANTLTRGQIIFKKC